MFKSVEDLLNEVDRALENSNINLRDTSKFLKDLNDDCFLSSQDAHADYVNQEVEAMENKE